MEPSTPNPSHGGSRPKPPEELRSPILRRNGAAVIASVIDRLYREWPEMDDQFGPRGRQLSTEDCHWHLNYLDAAHAIGDPAHFYRYVEWLARFLNTRGVPREPVAASFRYLAESLESVPCPLDLEAHRRLLIEALNEAFHRYGVTGTGTRAEA